MVEIFFHVVSSEQEYFNVYIMHGNCSEAACTFSARDYCVIMLLIVISVIRLGCVTSVRSCRSYTTVMCLFSFRRS